jgi:hypothetical protein
MRRRFFLASIAIASLYAAAAAAFFADDRPLGCPVRGVDPRAITSTFGAPRSGGRRHQGADVFAARGTPVLSAHDGVVMRVGTDVLGGNVVWTAGRRGVLCYYAHLDRVDVATSIGRFVREGDVLGYVGTTGNARGTPPHLHFEARPIALGLRAVDPVDLLTSSPSPRVVRSRRAGSTTGCHELASLPRRRCSDPPRDHARVRERVQLALRRARSRRRDRRVRRARRHPRRRRGARSLRRSRSARRARRRSGAPRRARRRAARRRCAVHAGHRRSDRLPVRDPSDVWARRPLGRVHGVHAGRRAIVHRLLVARRDERVHAGLYVEHVRRAERSAVRPVHRRDLPLRAARGLGMDVHRRRLVLQLRVRRRPAVLLIACARRRTRHPRLDHSS